MAEGQDERSAQLTELAILMHYIGRKLSLHRPTHSDVVPLSGLEGMFLEHIGRHPGVRPSQLSADLSLKSSNTSTVLRAMEAKGMIRRVTDDGDGRHVRVFLTERAEASISRIHKDWVRILDGLVAADADLQAAIRLLAEVDTGWDQGTSPR